MERAGIFAGRLKAFLVLLYRVRWIEVAGNYKRSDIKGQCLNSMDPSHLENQMIYNT